MVLRFPLSKVSVFKGTVSQDFRLLVFSWINFPQACKYSIPLQPFRIFSKIRGDIRGSRCTTGVNDTSGKCKKSSSRKILRILFGHLWVVELTYISIFAFKFTLRCLQPDIVPIICNRCQRQLRQICHWCRWHQWCTLTCEYLREFSKKIWNDPNVIFRGLGEGDSWKKNLKQKISWHCPFKPTRYFVDLRKTTWFCQLGPKLLKSATPYKPLV